MHGNVVSMILSGVIDIPTVRTKGVGGAFLVSGEVLVAIS